MSRNLNNRILIAMLVTIHVFMIFSNVNAIFKINDRPTTLMKGASSELNRPEGIAFTPSGKYIATANLHDHSITFYRRNCPFGAHYEITPVFSIRGPDAKLKYPHDLAFSPDGRHLAVANRYNHSITIYKKNPSDDFYHTSPVAIIQGEASQLFTPSGVRYSPIDHVIAVANTDGHSITFYRYKGDFYEQKPYQIIQDGENLLFTLNSLDFSMDGELLAVTVLDSHSVLIYKRMQNSKRHYTSYPVQTIHGSETNLCYPHSLSFHPHNNDLIVSNAEGKDNINVFEKKSNICPYYNLKPVFTLMVTEMYEESTIHLVNELHRKGGAKGISFSPDGTALAITQNLTKDNIEVPFSVSMLLIYSLFR